RAKAVSNDHAGAPGQKGRERPLNRGFGACIDGARGFVEDQDAWGGQHGAGEGEELALALAERPAPFPELRVITLWQRGDEVVGIHRAGCRLDLSARRTCSPEADVVRDRPAKEEGLLEDDGDL